MRHPAASSLCFSASALLLCCAGLSGQATPHHAANFDSERAQANELFLASKPLEALPLYDDLCRQDPTISVFAERRAAGLLARSATAANPKARQADVDLAYTELHRAQALGDNSDYLQALLNLQSKSAVGAIMSGIPLTIGYTYQGNAQAVPVLNQAESAFGRSDWPAAIQLYLKADALDPAWYQAALDTGDTYFRLHDAANAGLWFGKAIAIDPDRETAYRYWGDALFQSGDKAGARQRFVEAVVAEPYARPPMLELGEWAGRSGYQLVKPAITRPEFTTPNGNLAIDPALAASTADGRSSWIVYQQARVAHGARTLNQLIVAGSSDADGTKHASGYQHTIAEEHEAFRAMLAELNSKLKAGTLTEAALDPNLRTIRQLEQAGMLGAWIAINAADAGIHADYAQYRAHHRAHLVTYVDQYLLRPTPKPAA